MLKSQTGPSVTGPSHKHPTHIQLTKLQLQENDVAKVGCGAHSSSIFICLFVDFQFEGTAMPHFMEL